MSETHSKKMERGIRNSYTAKCKKKTHSEVPLDLLCPLDLDFPEDILHSARAMKLQSVRFTMVYIKNI